MRQHVQYECLFCKKKSTGGQRTGLEGKARIWNVCKQRRQLGDTKYSDLLEELCDLCEDDFMKRDMQWHKNCYASFTSQTKLGRLLKPQHLTPITEETAQCDMSGARVDAQCSQSLPARRSSQRAIDWSLCMFCQKQTKKQIHRVETFEKSTALLSAAKYDQILSIRFAGVSDLMAAEGCYHLACMITFERQTAKGKLLTEQLASQEDDCLVKLCRGIVAGLSRGNVYDMTDVWIKYQDMCRETGKTVPSRYQSRRSTFYESVKELIGGGANYAQSLSKGPTLMYPSNKSDLVISKSLTAVSQRGLPMSESESTDDEGVILSVFLII